MTTRLSFTALLLPLTKFFKESNIGFVHVRHVRYQCHGRDHLVRHFAAYGSQRFLVHRPPLLEIGEWNEVEEWNGGAGMRSKLGLGAPLLSSRIKRNLCFGWNRCAGRSRDSFFSKLLDILRGDAPPGSCGSN